MKHSIFSLILLSSVSLLFLTEATAGVHRWVDAQGNVHFGDQAPTDQASETIAVPKSAPVAPQSPSNSAIKAKQFLIDSEAAEAKKKEEASRAAKQKLANKGRCDQIKSELTLFERGGRITRNDPGGEIHFYSDAEIDENRIKYKKMWDAECR